ncbi:exonuclease SbcCD subunit D [Staphylococcus condimenti]|uniref:Nuclease SbcCD subunit D n=1 Tax=Staphylococcus condimenti TaxID=70255 RepID=A0A143P935_9STAP|nr:MULTISPECIES: exonuclease subunit SbcD [Staphylococcus]AMY04860.1 exonuclease sbcCD subunit D [Staphylococcus condimenti]APR61104.1 exonuclease sbcCD subunit D [Staphylococcus condimenti]MDK8644134.1 exonuclease subunit SbcD [Staphylococcus condimenti]OFP01086.1 exonuclease sbcCD subunit D [Staphylococcus sp. HMSC065E08]PNZ56349.1 exonuclease SbcCD subunit D [Staphylococcus condimenti]
MKVIHTADWHLGKILNGQSFLEDQKYILKQFIKAMETENPDLIVIAGDLYDTSYPSKEAIQLLETTISELNLKLQIPIIMISGNHDGKARLNYGASWFEHSQLYIRTELATMHQPISFEEVDFYTLPFATLSEMQHYFPDENLKSYDEAVECCLKHMSAELDKNKLNVLIAHMTVAGGIRSESERPLTIGTVEQVPEKYMAHFDTVMLGHLHHPFSIQSNYVFYSGSLLQYSFSETNQPKGYRRVLLELPHEVKSTFVAMHPLRELEVIEATYDDVVQDRITVKNKDNYIHFKLSEMSHISDPIMNIKQLYKNVLALTNDSQTFEHQFTDREIKKLPDQTIIETFYEEMTHKDLSEIQKKKVTQLLNEIMRGDNI